MPDPLREGLPRLFQHVLDKKQELRLIFEATAGDQADQLLSMPWEIIYIAEIKTHLGLMRHVTLARRLLETVRLSRPVLAPPYRIMHIIAEPDTYDQIDPRLQMGERTAICQAAGTAESYTLIEKPGSVERTLEQLRNQPYQIIHFLGHGIVESAALPQSYLLFASEDNMPQIVTSEQFPTFLSISPGTQIVVLNACHGASVEAANTVALQLVYHGIPYVVAMQSEVLQAAAQVFATIFYAALQKGESLEAALTQSRVEMAAVQGSIDWALPVLYVSAGAAEESALGRTVNAIEHWISDAQGQRQLGNFSIGLGVAHLIVATLLWISGAAPVLTNIWLLAWTLVLLPVALLLALWVRFFGGIALPDLHKWSRSGRAGLWLRIVVSAFIGLWLPTMYAWFTLLLLGAIVNIHN